MGETIGKANDTERVDTAPLDTVLLDTVLLDTVLLDVDGTLIDSTYLHALAWMRALHSVNETPLWFRVHRAIGMGGDKLVEHLGGADLEREHGDELRERWEEEYAALLDEVPVLPGARELIEAIRDAGLKVALASSGKARFTEAAMSAIGVGRDDVDAVTTSDDVEDSKPAPDLLHVALEQAGGRRGILVGDTTWDAEAAQRSGLACVGVLTGGFSERELRDAGAVEVVESVADLVNADFTQFS